MAQPRLGVLTPLLGAVCTEGGRQASPVIVAGSVFWADDRAGDRGLYRRTLRP